MYWQEIAALSIVGMTVALFVRGFLRRSPSACGRDCACSAVGAKSPESGASEGGHHKEFIDTKRN